MILEEATRPTCILQHASFVSWDVSTATQTLSYGATARGSQTEFRVWAPNPREVKLHLLRAGEPPQDLCMQRDGEDFVATATARPGDRYAYVVDGGQPIPDPVSRFLPEGVHGPTEILDPTLFHWNDHGWNGLDLLDCIVYELHIGTFTAGGTFDSAIEKLPYLKELGVTVVEIMPVAATPGKRNWGYDGVSPYAVQVNYGGPEGFRRFVDAAHQHGLAVNLDVVYNHLGPEGNYLRTFGPYFTLHHKTPWGDAINYDSQGCEHVRRYFIDNALYWIREYHIDGLRLDAVQTIKDDSPKHFLAELEENVKAQSLELGRTVVVIAETDENDSRYVLSPPKGYGLDGFWSDDFHHVMHSILTNERQGYYQDFGEAEQLPIVLRDGYLFQGQNFKFWDAPRGTPAEDVPVPANVICIQNHDQVGNRAKGERLTVLAPRGGRKMAAAVLLLAPHTPLLFMGQEYDESAPFLFFADFEDPALKKAVSEGRRSEFKDFDFSEVPDPEDQQTFERSKLTWADGPENREMLEWYRQLLRLRKQCVVQSQRKANAHFGNGILTVEIPATPPQLLIQASLVMGIDVPKPAAPPWKEVLSADDDGYSTRIMARE